MSWKIGQQISVRCRSTSRVSNALTRSNLADRPVHGDRAVRDRGAHRGEHLIEVLEGAVMQGDGVLRRREYPCAIAGTVDGKERDELRRAPPSSSSFARSALSAPARSSPSPSAIARNSVNVASSHSPAWSSSSSAATASAVVSGSLRYSTGIAAGPDLGQRHAQVAQSTDHLRDRHLRERVAPVAAVGVDRCRSAVRCRGSGAAT